MDGAIVRFLVELAEMSPIFEIVVRFFATWAIFLLAAGGIYYLRKWRAEGLTMLYVGLVLAFAVNAGIGTLMPRERPFYADGIHTLFIPMSEKSFPSDHAALAFALATMLWFYKRRIGAIAYGVAVCIAIARVAAGVHYPSDVIGGMLVGTASAMIARQIVFQKRKNL